MNHNEQHEEALSRLKALRVKKAVIENFDKTGLPQICFRPYRRFDFPQESEAATIQKFQQENDAVVYLVLRAVTIYGTLDSYLFVGSNPDKWEYERDGLNRGFAFTYTVNQNHPDCSEFGDISFSHTRSRGLVRTDIDFF